MPSILDILGELIISLSLIWLVMFFSTLVHELGHALFYTLTTGDNHWQIRIGSGKTLLKTQRFIIKWIVFSGVFVPYEDKLVTKPKMILILLGGPLFSLILFLVFRYLLLHLSSLDFWIIRWDSLLHFCITFNLSIFLASLLPMRYFWGIFKGMESDGLQLIKIIKSMWKK